MAANCPVSRLAPPTRNPPTSAALSSAAEVPGVTETLNLGRTACWWPRLGERLNYGGSVRVSQVEG